MDLNTDFVVHVLHAESSQVKTCLICVPISCLLAPTLQLMSLYIREGEVEDAFHQLVFYVNEQSKVLQ